MSTPFIILVDDDPDKRFLLERFLRHQFPLNKVASAANCSEAIPLVHAPGPKIVITNGRIDQHDGIEFAAYVTREVNAPVVMISLRQELKDKALAAGVSDFVDSYDGTGTKDAISRALQSVAAQEEPSASI